MTSNFCSTSTDKAMTEQMLQHIWQFKLFSAFGLQTTNGQKLEIIDVGMHNTDAGPDFINAKVKIGDKIWAGNVEIHTASSIWAKHGHSADANYANVVLHVVLNADVAIYYPDGTKVPQWEMIVPNHVKENITALMESSTSGVRCFSKISGVSTILLQNFKSALLVERLEKKTDAIFNILSQNNNHWEVAFYIVLMRNFGFGKNADPFQELAYSLPLSVLAKHKDSLKSIEAMLFGQAGLLRNATDDYGMELTREYEFLKHKFALEPIIGSQWKLLRMRPDNFPHVRIAQMAQLIHHSSKLFSKIIENPSLEYLYTLFQCDASEYWKTHYTFAKTSTSKCKSLGRSSVNIIIINTVVPFLFAYSKWKNDEKLEETALELLEQLPAEKNQIINTWADLGINANNAFDSQALLQLRKQYCDLKNCLRCRIGHKILTINT
jgi:Protein of unknown function (DUF2851)